jgi:hypothetical protein
MPQKAMGQTVRVNVLPRDLTLRVYSFGERAN